MCVWYVSTASPAFPISGPPIWCSLTRTSNLVGWWMLLHTKMIEGCGSAYLPVSCFALDSRVILVSQWCQSFNYILVYEICIRHDQYVSGALGKNR
jgi:hypothetical protein